MEKKKKSVMRKGTEEISTKHKKVVWDIYKMTDSPGTKLINCIKRQQREEALQILQKKHPDVSTTDESGRTALHFAAAEGYDELVEKLILAGAEVECWDNTGQSPVHKAAREGHVKALVILVAHGALINTMDWRGCPPIELALINHHLRITETLFGFGASLHHHHWDWMNKKHLNVKENMIKDTVLSHLPKVPGFKYGGIDWKLIHIDAKVNIDLPDLKLAITPHNRVRHPFYMYCCRMQFDYADIDSFMGEEDNPFSAVFEIRTWKMTMKSTFTFTVVIEGQPSISEEVVLVSSHMENGCIEMVDLSEVNESTHVTLSMTFMPDEVVSFTLCLREKPPETFIITKEAMKINTDDTASIDIPEGTFETPTKMSLQTTDVNSDTIDRRRSSVKTHIWNLVLDNKLQEKSSEPMEVHLHIHLAPGMKEDMAFINTSSEDPKDEDDWHVVDSQKTSKGVKVKCTFNRRVSIGGVSKKMLTENKKQVTDELKNYKKNIHEVVFVVMTKLQNLQHNVFSMVVECSTPVNADRNRNRWLSEGYEKEQRSKFFTVKNCQTFRISFKDQKDSGVNLTFQSHRKNRNYRILEFTIPHSNIYYKDEIKIDLLNLVQPEAVVEIVDGTGCCSMKQKRLVLPKKIKSPERLCSVPVYVKLPPIYETVDPNRNKFSDLDEDDECMISVLRYRSLKALSESLTLGDGKHMASQLKISQPLYMEIMKNQDGDHEKVFEILAAWRGNQPYLAMVDTLIYAVRSCNRQSLADKIQEAAGLNNVLRIVPDVAQH